MIEGAREVRKMLRQVNMESFVRTSGGKGLHVVAPVKPGAMTWDELKSFAKLLAQTMAKNYPKRYVAPSPSRLEEARSSSITCATNGVLRRWPATHPEPARVRCRHAHPLGRLE